MTKMKNSPRDPKVPEVITLRQTDAAVVFKSAVGGLGSETELYIPDGDPNADVPQHILHCLAAAALLNYPDILDEVMQRMFPKEFNEEDEP